jgi:tRNA-2-methylthio-N6-dimethylallyladenosine synthase
MTDHIVVFEGNERLIGQTVRVEIEEATAFTLFGTVVTGEQVGVERERLELRQSELVNQHVPDGRRIGLPIIS